MCNMLRFVNLNAELLFIDCFFGAFVLFLAVAKRNNKEEILFDAIMYLLYSRQIGSMEFVTDSLSMSRMIHVSFCRRIKSIVQKTLTNKLLADNSQLYCVIHAIRSGGCELGLLEFDNTHVQMIRDFFQHLT